MLGCRKLNHNFIQVNVLQAKLVEAWAFCSCFMLTRWGRGSRVNVEKHDSILAVLHGRVSADLHNWLSIWSDCARGWSSCNSSFSECASLRLSSWFASGNSTRSLLIIEILSIWMASASPWVCLTAAGRLDTSSINGHRSSIFLLTGHGVYQSYWMFSESSIKFCQSLVQNGKV